MNIKFINTIISKQYITLLNCKDKAFLSISMGVLLLLLGWHCVYQLPVKNAIQPNIMPQLNLNACCNNELDDLQTSLKREEEQVWQEIEHALGIAKEQIIAIKKEQNWQKNYADEMKILIDKKHSDQSISRKNMELIEQMMHLCGLDPKKINIVSSNGFSPAATTDTTLFINEEKINALSPSVQKFILVHEMSHIINRDHSTRCILEDLQEDQKDNTHLEHAINHIKYFSETKADVFAILHGQEFAQGQIDFMEQCLKLHGNKPGRSHPSNGERLAMGQKLLAQLEQKNNARA